MDARIEVRANGVESWLLGVNSGHILPGVQPTGVNAPARDSMDDCVQPVAQVVTFFEAFLRDDRDAQAHMAGFPRAAVPTETGECVVASDWPLAADTIDVELGGLVVPEGAGTLLVPLEHGVDGDLVLAGIPTFSATVPAAADDIIYLSLVVGDPTGGGWVIHDQVMPLRTPLGEAAAEVAIDLGGVATTVPDGAQLFLRVEGLNEQFLTSAHRAGALALTDVVVTLPHAAQGTVGQLDAPGAPDRTGADPGDAEGAADDGEPALPATGSGATLAAALLAGAIALRRREPTST